MADILSAELIHLHEKVDGIKNKFDFIGRELNKFADSINYSNGKETELASVIRQENKMIKLEEAIDNRRLQKNIKIARKRKGLSLQKLSESVNTTKGHLSTLENSLRISPRSILLYKIAVTLDTTMEDLLVGDN